MRGVSLSEPFWTDVSSAGVWVRVPPETKSDRTQAGFRRLSEIPPTGIEPVEPISGSVH